MKISKRILSFLLALVLTFTMLPLDILASEPKSKTSVDASEPTVEGINDLGNLLSKEIQENQEESVTEEQEYEAGYSIVDMTFDGNVATVEYSSIEDARLVVSVYTEDGLKMLASGVATVISEEKLATVTISGDMPEYFFASAYLVNTYDMSPLCAAYDTPMYTKEMKELLESTVDDYEPDRVLNLDEDKTNNFAVYADKTILIEPAEGVNIVTGVDNENGEYVVKNADEQILSLRTGDVIAYPYGENELMIAKVAKIVVNGNTVTIISDDGLELVEVFDQVKIVGECDDSNLTIEDGDVAEGIVYKKNSGTMQRSSVMSRDSDSREASASLSLSFEALKLGGDAANVKLTGSATLTLTGGVEYYITESYQRIELRIETSLNGRVGISGAVKDNKNLFHFKFDLVPSVLRLGTDLNFVVEVEGKVEASMTMGLKAGVIIDHGKQGWHNDPYCDPELKLETKFEGTLFLGLELEPCVEILYGVLADMTLTASGGQEYTLGKELHPENSIDKQHSCDKCFAGEIERVFSLEGSAKFLKMKKLSVKVKLVELTWKVDDIYWSVGMPFFKHGQCPNVSYKLTVNVVDTNGGPIKDAVVTAGSYSGTTNKKGVVGLFLPVAEYQIKVKHGDITKKHNLYMDSAQKIKVRLSPDGASQNIWEGIAPDNTISYPGDKCGKNLYWYLDDKGGLHIFGTGSMTKFYDWNDVPWNDKRSSIVTVDIDYGVTTISDYAFDKCENLTSVKIPNSVTTIGWRAFNRCTSLTSVIIPDSVTTIGGSAFSYCTSLASVTISDSVTAIGEDAFRECTSLTSIIIPDSVTNIGAGAFSYCTSLASVTISDSVTTISEHSFSNCTSLTSVIIPDSVTTISYAAFFGSGLTSVKIPDRVTVIGSYAFSECKRLKSVTISDSVTAIGENAFSYCTSLTSIIIPDSVTTIDKYAFYYTELKEIIFRGDAPKAESGGVFNYVTATVYYPDSNTTWTQSVIEVFSELSYLTWVPYTLISNGEMITYESAAITVADDFENPSARIGTGTSVRAKKNEDTIAPRSIYDGEYSTIVTDGYTLKTATFSGLVPGEQYVLLAMVSIDVEDPLAADNLLYIDQATALEDGTLAFRYVQRIASDTSYVVACGMSNKDLNDAEITFPEMEADGEIQTVDPLVVYDGKNLTEGRDYTILGTVSFTERGIYTCYIQGIRSYAGLVECTYIVGPINEVASGTCGRKLTWSLYDNGMLSISGTGPMTEFSSYSSVPWYDRSSEITTVIIDQGVTTIGDLAFSKCANLTRVKIPDSVTIIGDLAFSECASLTRVEIPDSVTTIGDLVFSECASLTSVEIPDSVTTIGNWAFRDCASLTSVTIGDGVSTISSDAFLYCSSLTSVTIGESVTTIGYGAFRSCTSLTSVTIPNSVTTIGNEAFKSCKSLTSVTIPDSVTTIGNEAFNYCTSLMSVTIPDSVSTIGNEAFNYCTSLTSVTIPDSVTTIGDNVFRSCTSLTGIYVDENNPNYSSDDRGVLFDKEKVELIQAPGTINGYYGISDRVTTIRSYAFNYCTNLTSVDIPDNVTTIGDYVFNYCTSLTSVDIPDSVTTVGDYAFRSCTSLTSVTIPDSVITIGDYVFRFCTNLTKVTIPNSVITIGDYAFSDCTKLSQITFMGNVPAIDGGAFSRVTATAYYPSSNPTWIEDVLQNYGGNITWVVYTPECSEHSYESIVTEPTCTEQGHTTYTCSKCGYSYIADEVESLGHSYESIVTEPTCTEIGYTTSTCTECGESHVADEMNALGHIYESVVTEDGELTYTCITCGTSYTEATSTTLRYTVYEDHVRIDGYTGSARNLVLPAEIEGLPVTYIKSYAFADYSWLTSVTIPDGVTVIGLGAFQGCFMLNKVTIPKSITTIGDQAFMGCESLHSITIPDGVTSIGERTFENCKSLRSIDIPDSVTAIGYRTFMWCYSLNSITIPNSVTEIDTLAFGHCSSLSSITIPDSVTSIDDSAFGSCTSLASIYFDGYVPLLGTNAFSDVTASAYYYADITAWTEDVMQDYGGTITWVGLGAPIPIELDYYVYEDYVEIISCASNATNVVIPAKIDRLPVTVIGDEAFKYNTSVTSITIPDSVTSIGESAFEGCSNLSSINIPDSVTSIGKCAFMNCKNMTGSINIPDGITHIGDAAFKHCGNLTGSVTIPVSLSSMGRDVFAYCNGLTGITIQDGVTAIADDTFFNCDGLTSINIPDSVISIGARAFGICDGLTSINIPDSVTHISDEAFYGCSGLKVIHFVGDAPELGKDIFLNVYASAYYSGDNPTWTTELMENCNNYSINWIAEGKVFGMEIVSTPECGIVGRAPNLSGLCVELTYGNDIRRPINNRRLTISEIDTTTAGKKNVTVSYDDLSAEFTYGVHATETGIVLDPSLYPESEHNYGNNLNESKTLTWPGAAGLVLVFSEKTFVEDGIDWIYVYDGKDKQIAAYSGSEAAGLTLVVPGDTVKIRLYSDNIIAGYGYSFASICTQNILHTSAAMVPSVEASCTESGNSAGFICEICDQEQYTVIPALGHDMGEWITVTAPTCTGNGYESCSCSRCDYYETRIMAATGHSCESHVTDPTCTEDGYTNMVCTKCNKVVQTGEVIKAKGHEWSEWKVTKNATCTEMGIENRKCSVCQASEKRDIEVTDHEEIVHNVKGVTCIEDGYSGDTVCKICKEILEQGYTIKSKGHTWSDWKVVQEATYELNGIQERKCNVCGNTEQKAIPALSHTPELRNKQDVTCISDGYTGDIICTKCNEIIQKGDVIKAAGHDWTDWKIIKQATCTIDGKEECQCKTCNEIERKDIKAEGHKTELQKMKKANCTEDGYTGDEVCTICNGVVTKGTVIKANGHTWTSWKVIKEPSYDAEGKEERSCQACSHKEERSIDKLVDNSVENPFVDVWETDYYYKAVLWALQNNVTAGLDATHFAPSIACSRGQVVTFLWRSQGCPKPMTTTNPFVDVPAGTYYTNAVLWALENKITAGIDATHFGPDETVTRAQFVSFLYRLEGKPSYTVSNPFTDIAPDMYYTDAVLWAVENKITAGLTPTLFGPEEACTRGQVVTFLYRAYE